MAYFPHAYRKVFVGTEFVLAGKTEDLTAGQFGFFNARTWTAIDMDHPNMTDNPQVVLAMGSYHSVDKINGHGGYKESIKSQIIEARRIRRLWKVRGRSPKPQIINLWGDGLTNITSPSFVCGQVITMLIDVNGSPALRALGHKLYRTFSVFTGCCANAASPDRVDPVPIVLEFVKQINADPLFSQFMRADAIGPGEVHAEVIDADAYVPITDPAAILDVAVALRLTMAYVDTRTGDCSFDPKDYVETEPLIVNSVQLVDDSGDPCRAATDVALLEIQAPKLVDGTGEKILRELVMFQNYRQEPFQLDPRKRQAEDITSVLASVSRSAIYDSYYILHSVLRKTNPSGVYDDDLYLIQVNVPEDQHMGPFEDWLNYYADSGGTGVVMEDLSGAGSMMLEENPDDGE